MKIRNLRKSVPVYFVTIALIFFYGCGSDSVSKDSRNFLYEQLRSTYLWSDHVQSGVDPQTYATDEALLDDLKYKPIDRYSFIMDKAAYLQEVAQTEAGVGLRGTYTDEGEFVVYYVLDNSPAQRAGMQRGDVVLEASYTDESGTYIRFRYRRDGKIYRVTLQPETFQYDVVHAKVLDIDGRRVGYLRYDQFTSTSYDNINAAFDAFKTAGIDDLILDLRYNPGGSVAMASILLDKIAGAQFEGDVQFALRYNEAYSDRDEEETFEADANSLEGLTRIMILTTENSASASELVINALKPYIEVVALGAKTYGKPVGMEVKAYHDRLYFLINFALVNAKGYGDYFDGLAPDCPVEDDLSHTPGDPDEAMTAAALHYLQTAACDATAG